MENPIRAPLQTELKDRVLWFDGDSAYTPAQLMNAIKTHSVTYVTEHNALIAQYNQNVSASEELRIKTTCNALSTDWTIPTQYKNLDVVDYLFRAHAILTDGLNGVEIEARERRLAAELILYDKYSLFDVLRTVIWIINTLTAADTVWGVGRGSSVSSYVLYIIGVHDVDSYLYQLDIEDFLRN